jgi:hypothetical protein
VATAEVPGIHGDQAVLVALDHGLVTEEGEPGPRAAALLDVLRLAPPYRARLLRRTGDVWAVAARRIATVELPVDPGGEEVEVAWDGRERAVRVDGVPRIVDLPELGTIRRGRVAPYLATLRRLRDATWEVDVVEL